MKTSLLQTVSMQELQKMRADGMTNRQIAEALETNVKTIHKYLGDDGTKKGAGLVLPSDEELLQMRAAGMTNLEIAEKVGCTTQTIRKHIGLQDGTRTRHAYDGPPSKRQKAPQEEVEAVLCLQNKSLELHGLLGVYEIDCKKGEILASIARENGDAEVLAMTFNTIDEYIDKAEKFLKELRAIKRKAAELRVENVMW